MKIGILTYHYVYNFGANLQALSTVGYLKNNGLEPLIINWIPKDLEAEYDRSIPKRQADTHKEFIKKYLPCTEICRSDKDIVHVIKKYNIKGVIIGSDVVLQHKTLLSTIEIRKKGIIRTKPKSSEIYPNPYWGSFISDLKENIPVTVMSGASQNTRFKEIRGTFKKRINIALNQFKYISVRDEWTKKMVKYLTYETIVPPITPDPVFAYNQNVKDQYSKEEILKKFNLPDKYILISFRAHNLVSKEWLDSFQQIAERNDLECVALKTPGGINFENPFSKDIKSPLCPKEWYGLIKFSSGYIGENMHPIVVALHNAIPFYSFDSYGIVKYKFIVNEKSSKIYDLLSISGFLKNRVTAKGKGYKCPTPAEVFQQIIDFDYPKCNHFSIDQQNRYNIMMKSIKQCYTQSDLV